MASISITSPGYLIGGVAATVVITGTGTSWSSAHPPIAMTPDGSSSGGSIVSQTVNSATSVTLGVVSPSTRMTDILLGVNGNAVFTDTTTGSTARLPISAPPQQLGGAESFLPGATIWIDWGYSDEVVPTGRVETYTFSDGGAGGTFSLGLNNNNDPTTTFSSFQIDPNGDADETGTQGDNWFGYTVPTDFAGDNLTITLTRQSDEATFTVVLPKGGLAPLLTGTLAAGAASTLTFGYPTQDSGWGSATVGGVGPGPETYTFSDGGAGGTFSIAGNGVTVCKDGDSATSGAGLQDVWNVSYPTSTADQAFSTVAQFSYFPPSGKSSVTITATPLAGTYALGMSQTFSIGTAIGPASMPGSLANLTGVPSVGLILTADSLPNGTGLVGSWTDSSGSGLVATGMGLASTGIGYGTGALNGRPTVKFAGGGTLSCPYNGEAGTIHVVARVTAATKAQTFVSAVTAAGGLAWSLDGVATLSLSDPALATFGFTRNPAQTPASGEGQIAAAGVYRNAFALYTARVWLDAVLGDYNLDLFINGKLVAAGRLGAGHTPSSVAGVVIGGRPDGTNLLTGDIALIIITPDKWTDEQILSLCDGPVADMFGGPWTRTFGSVAFMETGNEEDTDGALYVGQSDDGESFSYTRASHYPATSSTSTHFGDVRDPKVMQHPLGHFLCACTAVQFGGVGGGFSVSASKNGALWRPATNVNVSSVESGSNIWTAFASWVQPSAGGIYGLFVWGGGATGVGIVQMLDAFGEYWGTPQALTISGAPGALGDATIYEDPTTSGHFIMLAQPGTGAGTPFVFYATSLTGTYVYQSSPSYPTFVSPTTQMNDGYQVIKPVPASTAGLGGSNDAFLLYSSGSIASNVPALRRSADGGKTWGPEKLLVTATANGHVIGNNRGMTYLAKPVVRPAPPLALSQAAQVINAARLSTLSGSVGGAGASVKLSTGAFYG